MEATKDTVLSIDSSDGPDSPEQARRLHGSLRVGDLLVSDSSKSFNLRPSIDELPEEQALTIEINGWPAARLVCSPSATIELALGWSFARGYFDHPEQICSVRKLGDRVSIMLDLAGPRSDPWDGDVSAGFDASFTQSLEHLDDDDVIALGSGSVEHAQLTFDRVQFISIVERIFTRIKGPSFAEGVHYAAVTDGDNLSAIARDICRQNAVDKIIGWTIEKRHDRRSLILCVSGRVTADIAVKASRAGIPIVASRSVPTCEAVEIAHGHGVTLVGHILDQQRAIYAHPWRLTNQDLEL